jgi:hypothetical protein
VCGFNVAPGFSPASCAFRSVGFQPSSSPSPQPAT